MTYLFISNSEEEIRKEIHTLISAHLGEVKFKKLEDSSHPDIHFLNGFSVDSIGIAEARNFTKVLHKKPFKAPVHLGIIIGFEKTTTEAQNALLKEFEDHPATVIYILGVVDENNILPTIRSRATVKYIGGQINTKEQKDLEKFIPIFTQDTEDILSGFALVQKKEWTRQLAETFLSELYNHLPKSRENKSKLITLQKSSEYLKNNISPKQVITSLLLQMRRQ